MGSVETNPNRLSSRAAMGLPDRFVDRLDAQLLAKHRDLLSLDVETLVREQAAAGNATDRRIAAGTVLGLVGDPRLETLRPDMVQLPGGHATLGLDVERVDEVCALWAQVGVQRDWIAKESPAYTVFLAPFAIGRFPVTNQEYRDFLVDSGASWMPSSWTFGVYPAALSNHPVWTIPPEAADAYAAWLAQRTGRAFRLPTEAEWEYAASGGGGQEYPWGNEFLADHANTVEDGPLTTTPVGCYPAGRTASGLEDMAGNVEEYTSSNYAPYPGGIAVADDLTLTEPSYRVARGGSFSRYGDLCRCRRRHGWYKLPIYAMGFRLAESPRASIA